MTDTPPRLPTPAPPKRRIRRLGFLISASLILAALSLGFLGLALAARPMALPVWAVAEVEQRLNRVLARGGMPNSVSVGGIQLMLDQGWVPRLGLTDVRVLQPGGAAVMTLPEIRATFAPASLLKGAVRAQSLTIIGGRFAIRRNADGRFDLDFGNAQTQPGWTSFADLLNAADMAFSSPALGQLASIDAEALALTLTDARTGQKWQAGDGRLALINRDTELAAELSLSLTMDQATPARVVLTSVSQKTTSAARLAATVDGIAAKDLAAQAGPLAWLAALDAKISGRLAATIDAAGAFGPLESTLNIGAGVLRPTPQTAPIAFDRAGLTLAYDPAQGQIALTGLSVDSPSLRLKASGQSLLLGAGGQPLTGTPLGAIPEAFLAQFSFSEVMVDPAGLFESPMRFSGGALDLRLTLKPFALDIGHLTLTENDRNLGLKGRISADPKGWRVALDVDLDKIGSDQLLALWPVRLITKTRQWLALNLLDGTLFDVKAAVRLAPDTEPRLSLGYEFERTDVRFLKALPPIKSGSGYSSIEGNSYTLVLAKGFVTPDVGGDIDVAGTVFKIADITQRPTVADITLATRSSLTAALSLLDQPPFQFLQKARRSVDLGQGRAQLLTRLRFPLKAKVLMEDVFYSVSGQITEFRSDRLVPGRVITAPVVQVTADAKGLALSGKGLLDTLPYDVTFAQPFGPAGKAGATVAGSIVMSDAALRDLGVSLPKGMITGSGLGQITVDLPAGQAAHLQLTSDLRGIGLSVPALGWSKPAARGGKLALTARLGKVPEVEAMSFEGAGLKASGGVTLQDGGGLKAATFDRVKLDDWLDAVVTLEGRGAGRAVGVSITSGAVDLRRLAVRRGGQSGAGDGPLSVQLDRLTVSDGIALTDFRGDFSSKGGFNGSFAANVNDAASVRGTVVPSAAGSAVRIRSDNAGRVMAAAGVFANARGGDLDLQLTPTGGTGEYNGRAKIGTLRVQNASVLAELLSAISVVGILEQLNGSGLMFTEADVEFRLTPDAVEVTRGSAIGASLGVSMAGVYQNGSKKLSLQGVISPIYLLNGIGAFLTRRGEGLFGFNYKIGGTADDPRISVNPLSILTPGMFRDLFRKPAPKLPRGTG